MNARTWWSGAALMVGLAVFSSAALAQNKDEKKDAKPAPKAEAKKDEKPSEAMLDPAMMEAWMKASTPGQFHAYLKPMEGKWTYKIKMRMTEEMPWEEGSGASEYSMSLGGRFLTQTVKGDPSPPFPPFEGFGLLGYDNLKKQYVGTWADNMSTSIMTSTGTADASGKVITMTGSYQDPMTGKEKKSRTVTKVVDADNFTFEMYESTEGVKEFKSLEITYTRKK